MIIKLNGNIIQPKNDEFKWMNVDWGHRRIYGDQLDYTWTHTATASATVEWTTETWTTSDWSATSI